MGKIVCDICGGTLSMATNGQYATCDDCGLKHDVERLQVKLEEIKKQTN